MESEMEAMGKQPVPQTPLERQRSMRPLVKDHHHQDSLFGNSFQAKSFFVVHPEWLSEVVDNTDPEPLHRPPWPWEQPRYRQNIQTPITYKIDQGPLKKTTEDDTPCTDTIDYQLSPPPLPYNLPKGYTFTHPSIDETKPFEKQTQFGAPVVDTSIYKMS